MKSKNDKQYPAGKVIGVILFLAHMAVIILAPLASTPAIAQDLPPMSATWGVYPQIATPTLSIFTPSPTATLPTATATPTLRPTVTLRPLPSPTATRIPEKDCSLQIGGSCQIYMPAIYRLQRSGE